MYGLKKSNNFSASANRATILCHFAETSPGSERQRHLFRSAHLVGGHPGLGQQNGSEDSTRKIGLDAVYRFGSKFKLDGEAYRQYNLSTSAERDVGQLNGVYTEDNTNLRAGLRDAQDRMGDGSVYRSTQILGGVGYQMLDNRLQLRLDHDQSLAGHHPVGQNDPAVGQGGGVGGWVIRWLGGLLVGHSFVIPVSLLNTY